MALYLKPLLIGGLSYLVSGLLNSRAEVRVKQLISEVVAGVGFLLIAIALGFLSVIGFLFTLFLYLAEFFSLVAPAGWTSVGALVLALASGWWGIYSITRRQRSTTR